MTKDVCKIFIGIVTVMVSNADRHGCDSCTTPKEDTVHSAKNLAMSAFTLLQNKFHKFFFTNSTA